MRRMDDVFARDGFDPCAEHEQLIDEYVRGLSFGAQVDDSLGWRLKLEMIDHLSEAAADETGSPAERQRKAIHRFGTLDQLLPEYTNLAIERRCRSVRLKAAVAIAVLFMAMLLRSQIMGPDWRHQLSETPLGFGLLLMDRYGFLLAAGALLISLFSERYHTVSLCPTLQSVRKTIAMVTIPAALISISASAGIIAAAISARRALLFGIDSNAVLASILATLLVIVLHQMVRLLGVYRRSRAVLTSLNNLT